MGFHQLKPVSGHTGAHLREEVAGETAVMSSAAVSNIFCQRWGQRSCLECHTGASHCVSVSWGRVAHSIGNLFLSSPEDEKSEVKKLTVSSEDRENVCPVLPAQLWMAAGLSPLLSVLTHIPLCP